MVICRNREMACLLCFSYFYDKANADIPRYVSRLVEYYKKSFHHNPLLSTNRALILTIHKDRIFLETKKLPSEMFYSVLVCPQKAIVRNKLLSFSFAFSLVSKPGKCCQILEIYFVIFHHFRNIP